ncbi:MAG: 5-formyltetrahydrofolate cyclo-ligase [Elusimicrobia bacterium CG06_land_8_20_14_3_00_38_11]|nr:MAG: 5-formyltetrahydrofolate cyclo-ligase [Elusimicrobia bacterium CG06_land_8_20_14_3_00_38_11]
MKKNKIRKKIIEIRKGLDSKTVDSNSRKILKKLFRMEEFRRAKKVMFYSSFGNEVSTEKMIEKSLKLKKQVFLPKILKGKIVPVQIENLKELVLGKFGILEPKVTMECRLRPADFDVIIVPGVAFDKNCNRIGFGKGYFDRFLKTQKAKKIGLAHSFQIVKKIPAGKFDVPMDLVITEKNIFRKARIEAHE